MGLGGVSPCTVAMTSITAMTLDIVTAMALGSICAEVEVISIELSKR